MKVFHLLFLYVFGASCLNTIAQQASPDPEDHFAGVNARGDQGMGFSHEKTTHHFDLLADGGAIEIEANGPTDASVQGPRESKKPGVYEWTLTMLRCFLNQAVSRTCPQKQLAGGVGDKQPNFFGQRPLLF